jgi:hypothetical protein
VGSEMFENRPRVLSGRRSGPNCCRTPTAGRLRIWCARFAPLILWVVLLPGAATASTVIEASLEDIANIAEFIFAGTVSDTSTFRSEDGFLVTEYRFQNVNVAKAGRFGTPGRLRLVSGIVGQPALQVNERYIIFSTAEFFSSSRGRGAIVGLYQGAYHIGTDYSGKRGSVLDWEGRPVVKIRNGRTVVVSTGDAAPLSSSISSRGTAKVSQSRELPPKRPHVPGSGLSGRRRSREPVTVHYDSAPPTAGPSPPTPPELQYVQEKTRRWESRSAGGRGPTVDAIPRSADIGTRISETDFLREVRNLVRP